MSESHRCNTPSTATTGRAGSEWDSDTSESREAVFYRSNDLAAAFEAFARARSISADQADQRRAAAEAREHRAAMRTWLSARRMLLGRTEEA